MSELQQSSGWDDSGRAFSKTGFAYDTIRRNIIDGVYKPGDRLRMSELARQLNLSEMPVREALRLLQKGGLVILRLHRGAEVARLSFQRGRDVTEARMTLERAAALAAAPHHTQGSVAELSRLLAEMGRQTARPVKFAVKNRAFCTALFAPCPNNFMRQQIEDLWDQVWQASSTSVFAVMQHRIAETIEENQAILTHVERGDMRKLAAALDRRMSQTLAAWEGAVIQKDQPHPHAHSACPAEPAPPRPKAVRRPAA